jgi:hypothetical protein
MEKQYAKQIIAWAEEAKQTLTIRKEIIIDETISDTELGKIIRQMYNAKVESNNEQIERAKNESNKSKHI